MYIKRELVNNSYLQDLEKNQENSLYMEKDLKEGSGNDLGLEISLGIGIGLAVVVVGYLLYKKATAPKMKTEGLDEGVKDSIDSFINDIILDYYNEYRVNFLAIRYNIKELETTTSYVFKTKRIGSLSGIVGLDQVSSGEKYLGELIHERYNVFVPADEQLSFITEVSRIEGKMKAVESVKGSLPEEDYNKLISELKEDMVYYKRKYTTA